MGRRATNNGIEIRPTSIRVSFNYLGETIKETWRVGGKVALPTAANVRVVERQIVIINQRILAGTFVFGDFFPDSPRSDAATKGKETFGNVADEWFITTGQKADSTRSGYRNAIAMWKRLIGADRLMDTITFQFLSKLIGGGKWASAKSANEYNISLRGVMKYHYAGERRQQNPMLGIVNEKKITRPPDPLSKLDRNRVLADMQKHYDPRVVAYFTFAFFTGMRPEEMIALRWSDYDRARCSIHVQRVRTFKGSEREGTKTGSFHIVDLLDEALDALRIMQPYTLMKGPDADIFEHPKLQAPWHDERSQRDTFWKPSLKRLGIKPRRAYCTRHTYATVALMGGGRAAYVSSQMGHVDTEEFFKVYARWIRSADNTRERAEMNAAFAREVA